MTKEENLREIREAIDAANLALDSLSRVENHLAGARNWGLIDMFGGGFFTTMMKHSRLDSAKRDMEEAKYNLKQLQKELRDIDIPMNIQVGVGDFLTFADYFFDGFVADWLVQSKINDTRRQVSDAKMRVQRIVSDLHSWENRLLEQ